YLGRTRSGGRMSERLNPGVGAKPEKTPLFEPDGRGGLARTGTGQISKVEVLPFTGLAVRFVRSLGARLMLRGIRTTSDMEYEFDMSLTNLALDAGLETVFLMANTQYSHISGTLLRQIASFGGDLSQFVPPEVKQALIDRMRSKRK